MKKNCFDNCSKQSNYSASKKIVQYAGFKDHIMLCTRLVVSHRSPRLGSRVLSACVFIFGCKSMAYPRYNSHTCMST